MFRLSLQESHWRRRVHIFATIGAAISAGLGEKAA